MIKNIITLTLVYAIKYSNAAVITPDTVKPGLGITADLSTDPRSMNEINADNEWKLYQSWTNPLGDWYEKKKTNMTIKHNCFVLHHMQKS